MMQSLADARDRAVRWQENRKRTPLPWTRCWPWAGRMCDRLARQGLVRARRASRDRRAVLISVTAAGRKVAEEAAGRQRALVAGILARFPAPVPLVPTIQPRAQERQP